MALRACSFGLLRLFARRFWLDYLGLRVVVLQRSRFAFLDAVSARSAVVLFHHRSLRCMARVLCVCYRYACCSTDGYRVALPLIPFLRLFFVCLLSRCCVLRCGLPAVYVFNRCPLGAWITVFCDFTLFRFLHLPLVDSFYDSSPVFYLRSACSLRIPSFGVYVCCSACICGSRFVLLLLLISYRCVRLVHLPFVPPATLHCYLPSDCLECSAFHPVEFCR